MKRYGYFAVCLLAISAIAAVAVLGFDVTHATLHAGGDPHLITAEFGSMLAADAPKELKAVFDRIGEAFKAFKDTHDEELKGIKKGLADVVTTDKLAKITEALDKGVEAKAALDAVIAAEKKHVDEIEKKLNHFQISGGSEAEVKQQLEIKELNSVLSSVAAERKRQFNPLDAKGYDEYKAAQIKYLREGKDALNPEETKTLSVGNDPDGGYFVTPDINGRIVKKVFETSPIRQIAAQQTISTDALEGIEDTAEAGAGYAGERTQGSDTTTPQVGKWRIPVFWLDTEPKATQQLLDDSAVDIEAWLSGKVSDKLGRFENSEFTVGTAAANKIRGFTSYPTAADDGTGVTWGTIGYVASGASGDFAASNPIDKIHDLTGAVKSAYLANARFVTRRTVITKIRKFKDGQGNYIWQPSFVLGVPETIGGHPVTRAEDMPALGANSYSLAFGDFKEGYQIVDRQGIRVLRDMYTSKPYIKFYTTKRTGGGVLNYEAIKLMKFATS